MIPPRPPPGPPPAATPAATPPTLAAITAAVTHLDINDLGGACKAVDRVCRLVAAQGAQWPCAMTFLFGACQPAANNPCRRCADQRPPISLPRGTRPAIQAACKDLAVKARIIAGG